jgi:hypothetical protein
MPWFPESTDTLTEIIEADRLEETCSKLWFEFLRGYFDGATHYNNDYPLIKDLVYQTNPTKQELNGAAIHLVTNAVGKHCIRRDGAGTNAFSTQVKWTFVVKAKLPSGPDSDFLARQISDLLFGLLSRRDLLMPLNRAGIGTIRSSPPALQVSAEYRARKIMVSGMIRVRIAEPIDELEISLGGDVAII